MRKWYNSDNSESGVALVFAIGLLGLMLAVGIAFVGNALLFKQVAVNNSSRTQARMIAHSALSRAMASVMLYQEQLSLTVKDGAAVGVESVSDFGGSYSFDEINLSLEQQDGSTEKSRDSLLGSKSLLLLPGNDKIVPRNFAKNFNAPLLADPSSDKSWGGTWSYFKVPNPEDPDNDDGMIIGRAAWQVVSTPASILAPVFFRGATKGVDDDNLRLREVRWGRDIDEVFVAADSPILGGFGANDSVSLSWKMKDYETIYGLLELTSEQKVWFERWFIPDPDEEATVETPTPTTAETYLEGDRRMLRFNISEVTPEKYGVGANADPWYARFGANTVGNSGNSYESKPVINGEGALTLLSREAINYMYDDSENSDDCDYNLPLADRTSLPFLRLIGNSSENITFKKDNGENSFVKDLTALRKQIAANFNDYCDADSVPTSDLAAAEWGPARDGSGAVDWWDTAKDKTDPTFTGNELSPYIYEFGGSLSIVAEPVEKVANSNEYNISSALLRVLPVVKLVNIYPQEEIEKYWDPAKFYADVDFGKLSLQSKVKSVSLKTMKLSYQKNYSTDPMAPDWRDETFYVDMNVDLISSNSPVETTVTGDCKLEVKEQYTGNDNGNPGKISFAGMSTPYPLSFNGSYQANQEQQAELAFTSLDGSTPQMLKFDVDKVDTFITANQNNSAVITSDDDGKWGEFKDLLSGSADSSKLRFPNSNRSKAFADSAPDKVAVTEINVEKVSLAPRVVLRGDTKAVNGVAAASNVGVDYVKFAEAYTADRTFELKLNENSSGTAGIVFGGFRNYDPRQNFNKDDWFLDFCKEDVDNYQTFSSTEQGGSAAVKLNSVMCVNNSNVGTVNKSDPASANADALFAPSNNGTANAEMDKESVDSPAFDSGRRISTAYIRNAPMMSPWEIGFIHRGIRWQTINLKKYNRPKSSGENSDSADVWDNEGTKYSNGDAAILNQIRMTEQCATYGKININSFIKKYNGDFDADKDVEIFNALFRNVKYGENVSDFFRNSTRGSNDNFTGAATGTALALNQGAFDNLSNNLTRSFSSRAEAVEELQDAFGLAGAQNNDAAEEEIIGKTINLLSAESSANIVKIVIVAQSIRDNAGSQIRDTKEKKEDFNGTDIDIDDGVAVKNNCALGQFDMYEHKSDPEKNIYFDNITGEVKMLVTLDRVQGTGQLKIRKIEYIE